MPQPDPDAGGGARTDASRDALELLREAERIVAVDGGRDERMTKALRHMIHSTAGMVAALSERDLNAAHEALGHARASVATATYAIRVLHDDLRTGL